MARRKSQRGHRWLELGGSSSGVERMLEFDCCCAGAGLDSGAKSQFSQATRVSILGDYRREAGMREIGSAGETGRSIRRGPNCGRVCPSSRCGAIRVRGPSPTGDENETMLLVDRVVLG